MTLKLVALELVLDIFPVICGLKNTMVFADGVKYFWYGLVLDQHARTIYTFHVFFSIALCVLLISTDVSLSYPSSDSYDTKNSSHHTLHQIYKSS